MWIFSFFIEKASEFTRTHAPAFCMWFIIMMATKHGQKALMYRSQYYSSTCMADFNSPLGADNLIYNQGELMQFLYNVTLPESALKQRQLLYP